MTFLVTILFLCTDNGEMKDILEEAGVKSVSSSLQLCSFSAVDICPLALTFL